MSFDVSSLAFDAAGLVTVVVQDRLTGEIRMVAHANDEAVRATLDTGRAHFFSRSRQALWMKGESSGHTLAVHEVWTDCDKDALVYLVDPAGPTCHTGCESCFFEKVHAPAEAARALPALSVLEQLLQSRVSSTAKKSYTRSLIEGGASKIGAKLREEADELARAIADESDAQVAAEAADVLYHAMVGLLSRGVPMRQVLAVLASRLGVSGHDEKASRPK